MDGWVAGWLGRWMDDITLSIHKVLNFSLLDGRPLETAESERSHYDTGEAMSSFEASVCRYGKGSHKKTHVTELG